MPRVNIYNLKAEKISEEELNPKFFDVPEKQEVIQQVLIAQMANHRNIVSHTKGRSEVRGGGKKPWRQKGTGRARHGSIRSPLWRGGGITFGPTKDRNYKVKINKKMKKKALAMVFSDKVRNDRLVLVDNLALDDIKTKNVVGILNNFKKIFSGTHQTKEKSKKILMVYTEQAGNLIKAGRNIERLRIIGANNLNIKNIIDSDYLMMPNKAIKVIEGLYSLRKN